MLAAERENTILTKVNREGAASVRQLAELCRVTEVTIRRDLQRLETRELLRRTHGGAISISPPPHPTIPSTPIERGPQAPKSDALILAPVQNRAAHTLRERALRNQIPLLAESSAQNPAIYLGPDNFRASQELGRWTGNHLRQHARNFVVLDVSHEGLANTRERSRGFISGIHSVLGNGIGLVSVNGRGLYSEAHQIATDALKLHPEINVIFGVNDDSVLGAVQAHLDLGRDPDSLMAINIGGEGRTIFDVLDRRGPLKACIALFPELVGAMAIDAITKLWSGEDIGPEVITPHALITADTLRDFYQASRGGWAINAAGLAQTLSPPDLPAIRQAQGKHISFVIQYRTHEWYQSLAQAMQGRAEQYGLDLSIIDVNDDFKAEIRELRRLIGKLAASYVEDGDTIILDAGTTTRNMAQFLHGKRHLTVITNSMEVFRQLQQNSGIDLKLTGGDFHHDSQAFVGRGAQLLLREIRADKVFLVAGGISTSFGISSLNVEEAEVRRAMVEAAREVIVLADHTVLEVDSNVRVTDLDEIDTLITDAGILPSQTLALTQQGLRVIVAGRVVPAERGL